jgi:hypothetical protein
MSGQLVGEVIDAATALKAFGLSERGFHALVAIAEKSNARTRQGSVRWDHIRAGLYGASKRTAVRAVEDLKKAGVLRVVKSGFNNNHGRSCAPIYEIAPLTDCDTQVTQSPGTDCDKSGGRLRQNGDRLRHLGVVLDGSIDGSIDGGARASAERATTPTPKSINEEEPDRYCSKHMPNGTADKCRDCGTFRVAHDAWTETEKVRRAATLRTFWQHVEDCSDCGPKGVNDLTGYRCPQHDWQVIKRFRTEGTAACK